MAAKAARGDQTTSSEEMEESQPSIVDLGKEPPCESPRDSIATEVEKIIQEKTTTDGTKKELKRTSVMNQGDIYN